jgi:hypothetical protein
MAGRGAGLRALACPAWTSLVPQPGARSGAPEASARRCRHAAGRRRPHGAARPLAWVPHTARRLVGRWERLAACLTAWLAIAPIPIGSQRFIVG